jgi:D-glutamate cyclase
MSDPVLTAMRDAIQIDPGGRGLATDPRENLFTACPGDFEAACRSIATTDHAALAIFTGFCVLHSDPPCGETDGPLGALFLAQALSPLGIRIALFTDAHSEGALECGLRECGLANQVPVRRIQPEPFPLSFVGCVEDRDPLDTVQPTHRGVDGPDLGLFQPTHLLALERVGPNHKYDRYVNMRGTDITKYTSAADLFFQTAAWPIHYLPTIGVGDGGNEIGMGKIPREIIRRNIPNGDLIACRVPTDFLIVAGVSNWGAYALAAGVRHLRGVLHDPSLFDPTYERDLLELMVKVGPLVDGATGKLEATVDGLSFDEYAKPLVRLGEILRG